jgi:hypothetical protein
MPSIRIFQSSKDQSATFYLIPHGDGGTADLVFEYRGKSDQVRIPIPMTAEDVSDLRMELERMSRPAGKGGRNGTW